MLALAGKEEHLFLRTPPSGCSCRKTPVWESLFNSKYYEIFKSTYFEEYLRTAASKNVHEFEKN